MMSSRGCVFQLHNYTILFSNLDISKWAKLNILSICFDFLKSYFVIGGGSFCYSLSSLTACFYYIYDIEHHCFI